MKWFGSKPAQCGRETKPMMGSGLKPADAKDIVVFNHLFSYLACTFYSLLL